ncbi:MAG: polyprenyl diphosphate synthase [Bacilli bacterium]|nr:polyprenyl diphosphate synthase [Bacilli bacterium]
MKKGEQFQFTHPLNHVAFIMDGNGRWAKKRMLPRSMGHRAGVKNVKKIVDLCFYKYDIFACSLFTFSTENWNRPPREIKYLFKLLKIFFQENIQEFLEKGTRVVVSGDLDDKRIPDDVLTTMKDAIYRTKDCNNHIFNVLFNYGGRREIVAMTKKVVDQVQAGKLDARYISEATLKHFLYQPKLPELDLLIRTSGEYRLSNCLLYEICYSELIFVSTFWPDFNESDLVSCFKDYEGRNRRFGGIK